jgi:hypothetical protein
MESLHMLSSKSVLKRKSAIRILKRQLRNGGSYMTALYLKYIAEHDPCYTVRNIAREALYNSGISPESKVIWEKAYSFGKG